MQTLTINGYSRYDIDCNIHSFRKQDGERFAVIECTTEQLKNGDVEYMIANGLTLSASRIRAEKRKYNNRIKTNF